MTREEFDEYGKKLGFTLDEEYKFDEEYTYYIVDMNDGSGETIFNSKTKKIYDIRAKRIYNGDCKTYIADLKDGSVYFNVENGEIISEKFKYTYSVKNGFGAVKLKDDSWSLFCVKTKCLIDRKFKGIFSITHQNDAVKMEEVYVYDAKEATLSPKLQVGYFVQLKEDGMWTYYIPENDYLFTARYTKEQENNDNFSIFDALAQYPIDFAYLPTSFFENQEFVDKAKKAITKEIKAKLASINNPLALIQYEKELESIADLIKDTIKLNKEKQDLEEKTDKKQEKEVKKVSKKIESKTNKIEKEKKKAIEKSVKIIEKLFTF